MKKWLKTVSSFALATVIIVGTNLVAWPRTAPAGTLAKNVIVLIADGCGAEHYTLARWFKGAPLSFDPIRTGAVKTYIADSVVADSAPAASAYATGVRTSDKFISVGPKAKVIDGVAPPPAELSYRPLATVLEGAKLLNKATGIVATARVSHATPAAYMAHVADRDLENDIMEQAVYQGVDVVMGGGRRLLLPKQAGGKRDDGEDLTAVLSTRGYALVTTWDQMVRADAGKLFGMFADDHMDPQIDRARLHPDQPTLAEMTAKAIALLSKDPDGFFLMVEASQVDWASHANDPAHLVHDLLAYDAAVATALDFARRDGGTLVLALSDHNTGGLAIGNTATNRTYSQTTTQALLEPLQRMRASAAAIWQSLGPEPTAERLKAAVHQGWGLAISDAEAGRILELAAVYKSGAAGALGEVLCPGHTVLGWTTHGHTGGDVPMHTFGPGKPAGVIDAPEVARVCATAMGLDIEALNQRLFVEPARVLAGATVAVDRADASNPVATIAYRNRSARLPANKNLLVTGAGETQLEGVAVIDQTGRVFVPLQAVHHLAGTIKALPAVKAKRSHAGRPD